ncbi:MAG: hypothetical protein GY801_24510, partial [bacterium]|nr:hypothetical protein [bacterium]
VIDATPQPAVNRIEDTGQGQKTAYTSNTDAEPSPDMTTPGKNDELTPELVKSCMTLSLNKTAEASEIPRSTFSNFLNDKSQLSDEQVDRLRKHLFPATNKNIIVLEKHRNRLENQAEHCS